MNLDKSIKDILEAQKLLPHLPPVPVPPHPDAATSGTLSYRPNWTGDADLTPAEQAVKKQRQDRATLYWAGKNVENRERAEREAAAAAAREQEEADWVKASTREHTKKPKPTNEGVLDGFKRRSVLNALIKARTAQRDSADDKSNQLGLSMNTYLNSRDASRRADDSIEKNKIRRAGGRGRDYTDRMNAGVKKWFAKERKNMQNEEYTQVLEQMILTLTGMKLEELHEAVVGQLSEDYQTPARNAQMQDMYDRAEGKFMNNISSDKLLRKVWAIDNKNQKEQRSSRLYGKNGVQIKQTKKKRVRVGQPGGKQGGYQG